MISRTGISKWAIAVVVLLISDLFLSEIGDVLIVHRPEIARQMAERANISKGDPHKHSKRYCEKHSILAIYQFQYCLDPAYNSVFPEESRYVFIYHKPRSLRSYLLPGLLGSRYYFREMSQGMEVSSFKP